MLNNEEYKNIIKFCHKVSRAKNADYGSRALSRFGARGLVVRMNDKMDRLTNLVWHECRRKVEDEKAEETALDLVNYSIYLVMLLRGRLEK